jgi:hypothetical protein
VFSLVALLRLARVSVARSFDKGETILREGKAPDFLVTIANDRVKVVVV